ncbi:MAG: menaquinone biosynthesis protein [Planctomycetota bacterium]|nr:menaquinone biosynthesis protein [Planctomycetota bacterium]
MPVADHTALRRLRVGSVPYLVGRPLDLGLEHEPAIEFSKHVPAELVVRLRSGELDVALVSSIELFRAPGYRYIDGIAVAGASEVASVQLFLRRPIRDVRSIALDPASRAAATLVRILCGRDLDAPGNGKPQTAPEFVEVAPGRDPREAATEAWLRIGDAALREHWTEPELPVFNPSREWALRTALPFVFACWIVRADAALEEPHVEAFRRARTRGRAAREKLADEAAATWNLPPEKCRRYLVEECLYEPGAAMQRALTRFRDEAAALGLCDGTLSPSPIEGA